MRYREIPRNANNLPNFSARYNEYSFAMRHYIPQKRQFSAPHYAARHIPEKCPFFL